MSLLDVTDAEGAATVIGSAGASSDDAVLTKNQTALQTVLQKLVEDGVVPGIGAIVSVNGKRISAYAGYAVLENKTPMSEHSRFEISCLMKFYVSLVALGLAEEGKLDLNAPIGEYLPELREKAPDKAGTILVSHLMSHTSGYRGLNIAAATVKWGMTWEKFVDFFARTEQLFRPGTVFSYEHTEHVILGEILCRIANESAEDLVKERICRPLGIAVNNSPATKSYSSASVVGYASGCRLREFVRMVEPPLGKFWFASLPATALPLEDMAMIGDALVSAATRDHVSFATTCCRTQLEIPIVAIHQPVDYGLREQLPRSFGLCCAQYSNGVLGHNGSMRGLTCAFRLVPHCGAGIVVGTNVWLPHVRDAVMTWIVDAVAGQEQPSNSRRYTPTMEEFCCGFAPSQLAGRYFGALNSELTVTVNADGMSCGARSTKGQIPVFSARFDGRSPILDTVLPIPVTIFSDQESHVPCIRIGLNTYKWTN